MANLTVIAFDIIGSNRITFDALMPQNLCSIDIFNTSCSGTFNDTTNATSGFYNISAPATANGLTLMWVAFVELQNGSFYMGYSNQTTTVTDSGNYALNISVSRLLGSTRNAAMGNEIDELQNESGIISGFNFSTKQKQFTIFGESYEDENQNATIQNAFIEVETVRNSQRYIWMYDYDSQTSAAQFFLTDDTSYAAAKVFTDQFAPQEKELGINNSAETLELKQFEMFEFNENGSLVDANASGTIIHLQFKRDTTTCEPIDSPSSCDLLGGEPIHSAEFNPFQLLTNEKSQNGNGCK